MSGSAPTGGMLGKVVKVDHAANEYRARGTVATIRLVDRLMKMRPKVINYRVAQAYNPNDETRILSKSMACSAGGGNKPPCDQSFG